MITETHIRQWADRVEARSLLPVLVRRLIRETTPGLKSLRFPGNDAIALNGFDGEAMSETSTAWVPSGKSLWEMGCDQSPSTKAKADYDKRVKELDAAIRKNTAFVFVTPRRWASKEDWLTARRASGDWAEVHAWDVVDIETWLEESPGARIWLAERLGLTHPGLISPEDWYKGWASASTPSIPVRLVADRRGGKSETYQNMLRNGDRTIPIIADSRQEAVAFSIAALIQADAHDLLDRMVVVTSSNAVPGAGMGPKPILILDLPQDLEPALGDRNRFQIIRPMSKGQLATRERLELPHVGAEIFRESLEEAGLSRAEAQRRALEVGHSVTVLRRRLSDDPAIRSPSWARNTATARQLIPHALVGGWIQGERIDDLAIVALLAGTSEDEVLGTVRNLSRGEDAPLAQIGNVTVMVSQLDALFAVGPHIDPGDLDNFFLLARDVLGERDPKLDLPENEWWCANIHGKSRSYSGALLSGMGDTFGILATYGDAICGQRLGIDLPSRIERLVRDLLSDMTPDAWVSIRPHLRALAEASPAAFLDCVEADLNSNHPPVSTLMRCVGDAGISQDCLRTELLWALEALAWSPIHFARVAEIVFRLCAYLTNDNYSNSPTNTAAALFRDWVPSTTVGVAERMNVLSRLSATYRLPAIEVCKSLVASGPKFATRTAMPRWLAVEGDYEAVTNLDCWNARRAASQLLLDLAPLSDAELTAIVDAYDGLHPDDLKRLGAEVERWTKEASDAAKGSLAKRIRTERGQLDRRVQRSVQGDDDRVASDEHLAVLGRMLDQLRPVDARQRHLWLFEQEYISWSALGYDGTSEPDWRKRDEYTQKLRRDALEEIERMHGEDGVYEFALNLAHPQIAARILAGEEASQEQTVRWATRALTDADSGSKAEQFLMQALSIRDEEKIADLVGEIQDRGLLEDEASRYRLGRCLPNMKSGWQLAERIGDEVQSAYWKKAYIQIFRDDDAGDADFVVKRLLEASRPKSAYAAACFEPRKISAKLWIDILHGIARGDEPRGSLPDRWHLVQILQYLDASQDVTEAEIAGVEWPFARFLEVNGGGSDRPVWATHRIMMRDPSEFIGLLRWIYPRADGAHEPDMESVDPEQLRIRVELGYHIFHSWSQIPGLKEDGTFDDDTFLAWSDEMMRLAEEQARLGVALSQLADCLARVAKRNGFERWLPAAVLRLLDRPDLTDFRRSFEFGVYNSRGVTVRGPYDGGEQERTLSKKYRELGVRQSNSFPRVAAMLERIAQRYERDAKREDESAELGERWHP